MGPFESSGAEWATPEYDAAGNMISGPRPGAETTALHYVYDAWNRMVKVADASDETVAEYQYDGLNRRVVKLVWNASSETWSRTDYYYNEEWQVLEERGAVGVSTVDKGEVATDASVQYLWDPKYIDSPILRWRNANTSNADLEEVLYYTTDANMNMTALVNDSGEVVERDVYAAYGTTTVLEPDGSPRTGNASGVANEIGYGGYRKDPETGLWYVRMRYLHPTLAVWTSRDPEGYVDGMGLYEYVSSSPVQARDTYGLRVSEYRNCDASQIRSIDAADKAATQRAAALAEFFKNKAYKVYEDFLKSGKGRYAKDAVNVDAAMQQYCATMATVYGNIVREYNRGYIAVGSYAYKSPTDKKSMAAAVRSPEGNGLGTVTFYKPFFDEKSEAIKIQASLHETSHLVGVRGDTLAEKPWGYGNYAKNARRDPSKFLSRMVTCAYHIASYAAGDVPRGVPAQWYIPRGPTDKAQDAEAIMEVEVIQYALEPDLDKWQPSIEPSKRDAGPAGGESQ